MQKGQLQVAGFTPFGWDIFWKSHGIQPNDMLFFRAEISTGHERNRIDDITSFSGL